MFNIEIQTDETPAVYLYNLFKTIIRLASEAEGESEEIIYLSEIGCAIALAVFKQDSEREDTNSIDALARHLSLAVGNEHIPIPLYNQIYEGFSHLINTVTPREELTKLEQTPEWIAAVIRDYVEKDND